jgi:hypothetical protein
MSRSNSASEDQLASRYGSIDRCAMPVSAVDPRDVIYPGVYAIDLEFCEPPS